jgi:polysaccharide deacetylase family protein (PEP-CTERM system associated)
VTFSVVGSGNVARVPAGPRRDLRTVLPVNHAPPLLLSVDFEDWHQLVRRRVGAPNWCEPGPALTRQTRALLDLLDELGVKATFFVLGMAARSHPELVESVVERGHEIGCHGDAHVPVHTQTPEEFAADLEAARATIEQLTGIQPLGYRAPAFSITRASAWAHAVLAEHGFAYDASQHNTPRIRDRARSASDGPHPVSEALFEFPVAVWHSSAGIVPVGGASYWAVLPTRLVIRGLQQAGAHAGLYLHPHEVDPEPLRAQVGSASAGQRLHARVRAAQRNAARRRAPAVLRTIAERFKLIPYGEAYAQLARGAGARPQPVPR